MFFRGYHRIARRHLFLLAHHPLTQRESIILEDLAFYPRFIYDQSIKNSFSFAEEPHVTEPVEKAIIVSDRASLFNLLIGLSDYAISSGILSVDLNGENIVAVPLIPGGGPRRSATSTRRICL